jgi:hypothetical protein
VKVSVVKKSLNKPAKIDNVLCDRFLHIFRARREGSSFVCIRKKSCAPARKNIARKALLTLWLQIEPRTNSRAQERNDLPDQ